ncbi:phosphate acyltransferase PlsX [Abyssibius alkaniclasticus]|uniref:phosphate acyltransferase PlsX n=1 Tax=Abyssibius alkaniclasticus TaxID=2881234 RepID=UPI0023642F26|nr:phosphate acyltransferase PlsX [Abyssibius alkaniclasticus]UPH70049.1 phosphate acyltransferase PlsX [Abyssibius alkaniclasticus]
MTDDNTSLTTPATTAPVVISIDAMGGDLGPRAVIGGMAKSAKVNPRIRFVVHGDRPELEKLLKRRPELAERCEIIHTEKTISMDAKPSLALRNGKGTSMMATLQSVAEGKASVAVSCGNTGALMALSMLTLRKAPGVNRPAIGVLWPSLKPPYQSVMLDVGADIRADADDLLQYAIMGASYARNALGLARPKVGLLNVGTEQHKGRAELHEAAELLTAAAPTSDFEFVGYVEGNDLPTGRANVIVTDGFTGNIALKAGEGTAAMVRTLLKEAFSHSILSRLGALFALTSLRRLQARIDPRRVNGGVFLGLNGTVIKSHGRADATGFSAAIKLAFTLTENGFTERLAARVASGARQGKDTAQNAEEANS